MWSQYKQTFLLVQLVICLITVGAYLGNHQQLPIAAFYFLFMQVGALLGASWAARLKQSVPSIKK